jgi:hypothetical protein
MNQPIKWRPLGTTVWRNTDDAVLVDGLSQGLLAIKTSNGYVTTDRDGSNRYEPNMGAWEGSYSLDMGLPILHITPNVVSYVLEIAER